jgi:hypothetical protein
MSKAEVSLKHVETDLILASGPTSELISFRVPKEVTSFTIQSNISQRFRPVIKTSLRLIKDF